MPTSASRARRWLRDGKAKIYHNDLGVFCVQLIPEPSNTETQPIAVGLDPGKMYSGVGVQSKLATLWTAHLILPFKTIKERMELRRVMRRARRGRRINRQLPFSLRCHRQKRFNNRKKGKLPPSIRANKQLEFRVIKELFKLYPISTEFIQWQEWHTHNSKNGAWLGQVTITYSPFAIIRRPPICRRQLHLCVPAKGGKRRKYGGTVTSHGFRKGDRVKATKAGKTVVGWCSGDTAKQVSVSDINWKRLGQFTVSKVVLLQRATGLICKQGAAFVGATIN